MDFLSALGSPLEIIAAIVGVVSVYLSVRQNIWSWPTAIVNVSLYVIVFYEAKLYADMGLQVVYIALSFYGWYQWLYGGANRTELPVTRIDGRTSVILAAAGVTTTALLGTVLHGHTNAALPFLDSATTATSLVAQWMMTRKLLENWMVWIAVDVVYVGMFIYKSLYVTAVLYAIFLGLAVAGHRQWTRSLLAPAAGVA